MLCRIFCHNCNRNIISNYCPDNFAGFSSGDTEIHYRILQSCSVKRLVCPVKVSFLQEPRILQMVLFSVPALKRSYLNKNFKAVIRCWLFCLKPKVVFTLVIEAIFLAIKSKPTKRSNRKFSEVIFYVVCPSFLFTK